MVYSLPAEGDPFYDVVIPFLHSEEFRSQYKRVLPVEEYTAGMFPGEDLLLIGPAPTHRAITSLLQEQGIVVEEDRIGLNGRRVELEEYLFVQRAPDPDRRIFIFTSYDYGGIFSRGGRLNPSSRGSINCETSGTILSRRE